MRMIWNGLLALVLVATLGLASLAARAEPANYFRQGDQALVLGGTWLIGGTAVSASAAELNAMAGVTAGTVTASKGVVVDANKDVSEFRNVGLAGTLTLGAGGALNADSGTATATGGAATLAKMAGKITSEALTTAAGADYTLTLTNSSVAAADLVLAAVDNGSNTTAGLAVGRVTPGAGQVIILIRNTHASAALNGTIVISFVVIKA